LMKPGGFKLWPMGLNWIRLVQPPAVRWCICDPHALSQLCSRLSATV
jgi:hypothetical protein